NNLVNNYLKNNYRQTGPVIYAVTDSVGYIYYSSFENHIADRQLDTVFSLLKNTKGLIVDIRSNTGGATQNIRLLFQRFLASRKLVKYEIRKIGTAHNDFAKPEAQFMVGTADPYLRPVCVLTNRSCFSACNDFAMFMSGLTNVRLVGDSTGGGGGIPVRYVLANGWILQYTATMTVTPDLKSIENGIPPTIPAGISTLEEQSGKDPILEKAFSILK
ncbi:MAG: peptidase S41, partial [Chitinophagaceae bacterium]|nr:peptidase S41 [Chitinophagaceae bacterium]